MNYVVIVSQYKHNLPRFAPPLDPWTQYPWITADCCEEAVSCLQSKYASTGHQLWLGGLTVVI